MFKILVVDDHEIFRDGICSILQQLDDDVSISAASTGAQGIQIAQDHRDADLMMVDFNLPDTDGIHLLKTLKEIEPDLPVVVMSGHESDRIASQALASGASGFIPKSLHADEIRHAISDVLKGNIYLPVSLYEQQHNNVASTLVDGQLMTLSPQILDHNPSPVLIFNQEENQKLVYANQATDDELGRRWAEVGQSTLGDCIPDTSVVSDITRNPNSKLLFEEVEILPENRPARWFNVSAGPVTINNQLCTVIFLQDVSLLKLQQQELEKIAMTDTLTGVLNRRGFFLQAAREVARATRYSQPFSVLLFDLDHFKQINDTDGHVAGDELLKLFGQHCLANLRPEDTFGRYGGEEFVALLVHTEGETALEIANRLREQWQQTARTLGGRSGQSTVSIGIACHETGHHASPEDLLGTLIRCADERLYAAKVAGRNRCILSD